MRPSRLLNDEENVAVQNLFRDNIETGSINIKDVREKRKESPIQIRVNDKQLCDRVRYVIGTSPKKLFDTRSQVSKLEIM